MSAQFAGSESSLHRRHWYVSVGAGVPVQAPGSAVNVWPATAAPVTDAATEFAGATGAGGAASTAAVASEVDVSLPTSFLAVTTTRTYEPTSSGSTTT